MASLFDRLPANFKQGDILSLGRGGNLYPAGANGSDGQFLQRSGGLWVPHTLVLGDINNVFSAGNPTTSAVGDAATGGTSAFVSHHDHLHGREAFGSVTAEPTVGSASANGSAVTEARADHAHGNPTAAAIAAAIAPAWTGYTPTFAPTGGTFTTASASGRWLQIGKTLFLTVLLSITNNGTGSGFLQFTLPNSLTSVGTAPLSCREAGAGQIYSAYGQASSAQVIILPYNSNGYAGASGTTFYINGSLEVN